MAVEVSFFHHFPNELFVNHVLPLLDGTSLLQARQVSNGWKTPADGEIRKRWEALKAHPVAAASGLTKRMMLIEGEERVSYLNLFRVLGRQLHLTWKGPFVPIDPRCFFQPLYDQALMQVWPHIRAEIDPKPHQIPILPPLETVDEIRSWLSDPANAPLVAGVELEEGRKGIDIDTEAYVFRFIELKA